MFRLGKGWLTTRLELQDSIGNLNFDRFAALTPQTGSTLAIHKIPRTDYYSLGLGTRISPIHIVVLSWSFEHHIGFSVSIDFFMKVNVAGDVLVFIPSVKLRLK